jgi:hypothetical protein
MFLRMRRKLKQRVFVKQLKTSQVFVNTHASMGDIFEGLRLVRCSFRTSHWLAIIFRCL